MTPGIIFMIERVCSTRNTGLCSQSCWSNECPTTHIWYIHGKTPRDIVFTESQWVKYCIISNMLWPGFSSLLSVAIFQLFTGECFVAMKRRLCVDFEMNHKRAQHDILSAHSGLSKGQCMMKCVADAPCTAFNFRSGDGFCEHMPELPKCYEPDDNEDFTFTQLRLPDFKPLMAKQAKPLGTSDMEWLPCDSTTVPTSSNVRVTSDIYVALCFHRGMYLPAYWKSSLKLMRVFYPPDDKGVLCDHGYVLSAQNPEQYKWASFHTGSPIPVGSVSCWRYATLHRKGYLQIWETVWVLFSLV